MADPLVLLELDQAGVVVLTLNRPDKRNALSIALLEELCSAIRSASETKGQRVLILKGSGSVFCAGLDLEEARDREKAHHSAAMIAQTLETIFSTPLITIAAVQGAAMAGGVGILSACDFVIASEDARIACPETQRGLVAAFVMTLLCRQLKERHTRELLLSGEALTAQRACDIGLVNRVVPSNLLSEEAMHCARSILRGAPQALSQTKQLLHQHHHSSLHDDLKRALDFHMEARNSEEALEGICAFLEKREPQWK